MKNYLLSFLLFFSLLSCENSKKNAENQRREKEIHEQELKLKEQEINLKEKEIILKEKEIALLKEQQNNKISDLPKLYDKVKSSVYLIYTLNTKGLSQGSAFVISTNGIAISNFHVFESASEAIAINENGEKFQISEILDFSKENDYIIFRLNTTKSLSSLEISNTLPEIGEECFAVGNPEGLTQTLSKGVISSYRDNNNYIQTTTEITHGSSGGPLFNNFGKVIGITTKGKSDANLNFALNILKIPYSNSLNKTNYQNNNQNSSIDQGRVRDLIQRYYTYVESESFNRLNSIFASKLSRFYSNFDVSINQVIQESANYKKQYGVTSTSSKIRWDSFRIISLNNGNYSVDYILDYTIIRTNKNKPSNFVLHIMVEVTNEYLIKGIYENIINKF
jgi:serine protease Do